MLTRVLSRTGCKWELTRATLPLFLSPPWAAGPNAPAQPGSTGTGDPRWTALPDSVPQRVHDLARQLAAQAAAPTPYAIAETVQAWIGDRVAYSLEGPVVPRSADPVDHLLEPAETAR